MASVFGPPMNLTSVSNIDMGNISLFDIFSRSISFAINEPTLVNDQIVNLDRISFYTNNSDNSVINSFYGHDLGVLYNKVQSVGTVTSFAYSINSGKKNDFGYAFTDFSIPMSEFIAASATVTTIDDNSLFSRIFSGNDKLMGTIFNDNLIGYGGDDLFFGVNSGDDIYNGGSGTDVVVYTDKQYNPNGYLRTEFLINKIGDDIIVADTNLNRFGTDLLSSIELIVFQDKIVRFDINDNAGEAYRLYEAAFNRKPDAGGLGYWIAQLDKGATLKSVAEGFLGSAEFKALYGSSPTNAVFVDNLYKNILDRAGEKGGVDYWNGVLNNGVSRADVLVSFSESAENKAGVIGSIQNGIEYKEWLG